MMYSFDTRPRRAGDPQAAAARQQGLEHEADRAADHAAARAERAAGQRRTPDGGLHPVAPTAAPGGVHGQPLDPKLRTSMEAGFGHDFGQVRVHTDARAATSAGRLDARAYTVGSHIMFGSGEYAPDRADGRRLIAHELAHVVQQRGGTTGTRGGPTLTPAAPSVQRKLAVTGVKADTDRMITLMNAGLQPVYEAKLNKSGEVEISSSGGYGPLSPSNQIFYDRLNAIVAETATTTVSISAGSGKTIVGSYATGDIDIGDIEALGMGDKGWDSRAALLHELVEQRQKQQGKTKAERDYGSATTGAHGEALKAELGFIGASLESETITGTSKNPDGTVNLTRTNVFKYPDGTKYQVDVTVDHNNITAVKRTKLP